MNDLHDLYQNAIVDHYKRPRNFHEPEKYNRQGHGHNPLCGDKISVFLYINNNTIEDIRFTGNGCAIATASASMMTENLKGKTEMEARASFERFVDLLSGSSDPRADSTLGNLTIFSNVRDYPARVKCALLAWHTLLAALEEKHETVETE